MPRTQDPLLSPSIDSIDPARLYISFTLNIWPHSEVESPGLPTAAVSAPSIKEFRVETLSVMYLLLSGIRSDPVNIVHVDNHTSSSNVNMVLDRMRDPVSS